MNNNSNLSKRIFIFARGGSKGLPGKNIMKFGDRTLLEHSIKIAKTFVPLDEIYVSTDCEKIKEIARTSNVSIIDRPADLASDSSPEWLSWQHGIKEAFNRNGHFDIFISLPVTAPLRNRKDVLSCICALKEDIDIVVTMTKSQRSPWFNMVKENETKKLELICQDSQTIKRRQDSPICFDLTTVAYVAKADFVLNNRSMWDGALAGVEVPKERAIDIDDEIDFKMAELLIETSS